MYRKGEREGWLVEEEEERDMTDILQYSVRRGGCGKSVREGKDGGVLCVCITSLCVCVCV